MEYKVISSGYHSVFEEEVNAYLRYGWVPQGGVSSDGEFFYQAMVREKKEKTK